ncbi:SGNH/GDSL hydrolase family protein [Mycobacterium alsense]|uniref:SGNH/GDSL hydrolase family protein n=1 Tax=Mycobacterium alsense TaxID=324058 RepID=UPI0009F721A2
MKRYVALGSSMAAGPGIRPRAAGAPLWSGRSARNYPHLVAERLNLGLIDVTFSGATTAHVLADSQRGKAPQIAALDGSESVVTVTIGGNDVGYVPLLMVASLPHAARRLPLLGRRISELLDRDTRDRALAEVFDSLCAVGTELRRRAPGARVFFVDYLTILPPAGAAAAPTTSQPVATAASAVRRSRVAATWRPSSASASRSGAAAAPAGGRIVR